MSYSDWALILNGWALGFSLHGLMMCPHPAIAFAYSASALFAVVSLLLKVGQQ